MQNIKYNDINGGIKALVNDRKSGYENLNREITRASKHFLLKNYKTIKNY
jgi:hypothetical protein